MFLFSSLLAHGVVPDDMTLSTVIPIPKSKNYSQMDSSNYRGIALSSIYGKSFDLVILSRYSDCFMSSDLQFGYKTKRSTAMCTMKQAVSYYINYGRSVYCTLLDAIKAFDRVDYCKLFRILIDKKLPTVCIRLLANMYTNHVTRVAWNDVPSGRFSVKNGVKQGGVLSLVLFCLYLDGLLSLLAKSGVGCLVGEVYVGALAYADDIVLLAPPANAMRHMLKICDIYASDYSIVFNASNSKCIFVQSCRDIASFFGPKSEFFIDGNLIEYVKQWSHLGHIVTDSLKDAADIASRRNSLCGQINNLLCYFGKLGHVTKQ